MGFAWTNGGTPSWRSTAAHGLYVEWHRQLADGSGVTRISSPSPTCWSIRHGLGGWRGGGMALRGTGGG
jgi:hypothetical protein